MTTNQQPSYPFGNIDWITPASATGATAVTIDSLDTVIYLASMAGAVTLNLTVESSVRRGARLRILVLQNATGRNVALGTGFITNGAPDLTGVANDYDVMECIYDGSQFISTQTWQKVFDAA